jgi:hypothetical protein
MARADGTASHDPGSRAARSPALADPKAGRVGIEIDAFDGAR